MQSLNAIIFDLGRVVVPVDFQATVDAFSRILGRDFSGFYRYKQQTPIFDDLERGRIDPADFLTELRAQMAVDVEDEVLLDAWNAMLTQASRPRLERLSALRPRLRTFILSNTNALHAERIADILRDQVGTDDLTPFFDGVYYSHEIGHRKPDAGAYQAVVDDAALTAGRTLFIDDIEENVMAARDVGLRARHLQNMDELFHLIDEELAR